MRPNWLALALLLALPTAARAAGPDASGNYTVAIPNDFVPLVGVGTSVGLTGSGSEEDVSLPFSFPWYGLSYSTVSVATRGGIRFTAGEGISSSNGCLPDSSNAPDIAVFWDNLVPSGGDVLTWFDGAGGRFIISWEAVGHDNGGDGSFQIHLLPTGAAELHYADVDFGSGSINGGESATIGFQDVAGGSASAGNSLEIGCGDGVLTDSSAFAFGPCDDVDGDGFAGLACGGEDCDDTDAAINPDSAEICDGLDNDCDGQAGAADAVFDTSSSNTGNNRYRGNVLQATSDDWLGEAEMWADISGPVTFTWAVYTSGAADGPFSLVTSQTSIETATGPAWRGSGPLNLPITSGQFYAVIAAWSPDVTYYYRTSPTFSGATTAFGQAVRGVSGNGGAPGTLGNQQTTTSWGYRWRYTSGGDVDSDGDGSAVCAGDCDDTVPTAYPGAPELCDGVDSNCDGSISALETDADGDGAPICLGDCDDANPAVSPLLAEACDGLDTDCDGILPPDEIDGDGDGVLACDDCDDGNAFVSPGADEVCDGFDSNCDSLVGQVAETGFPNAFSSGGDRMRGNLWAVTSSILLGEVQAFLEVPQGETLTWLVYQGGGQTTNYTLIAQETSTAGALGAAWHTSPSMDVTLGQGAWYAIMVHWTSSSASYGWNDTFQLPDGYAFGIQYDGIAVGGATPPGTFSAATNRNEVSYPFKIATAAEADADGDGSPVCADCDDIDSANAPGGVEICDGQDNDCDASTDDAVDADGDGASVCGGDCDDADAAVSPGAAETCNGVDDDCDGSLPIDETDFDGDGVPPCAGDCNDLDITVLPGASEVCDGVDNDCDATTWADAGGEADVDADGSLSCVDCDDNDAANTPGGAEICDGQDNDCDAGTDELADVDGDGFTLCDGDCDDANSGVGPTAVEACDGLDNDCDGTANFSGVVEVDGDGDGSFNCADCDDADAANFPGNVELCDGQDNDCDGAPVPTEVDDDGDGVLACFDCDDADAANFPDNPELCDGQDNDCDTSTNGEDDGDGDGSLLCDDCDDADGANSPAGVEVCDGQDNDCDDGTVETVDGDGDGVSTCQGDCDDTEADVFAGNPEVCDGLDNDCDTDTDELVDADGDGDATCDGDCDDADADVFDGAPEVCDGKDSDCDGTVPADESDDDADGQRPCGGDCDDDDPMTFSGAFELCDGKDNDCDNTLPLDELDADDDEQMPCEGDCDDDDPLTWEGAPEVCDGLDNDCDGTETDELADEDGDGMSPCDGDCDDRFATVYPGAEELCDGLDNDCDGEVPADEEDQDLDGFIGCEDDCNDFSATTYPGAPEVCDGADNDCDGTVPADEADADGDGWETCNEDCDDGSAAAFPGGVEASFAACIDGVDNDCDGLSDAFDPECADFTEPPIIEPEGCANCESSVVGSARIGWWLLLGVGLLVRRRRSGEG